MHLFLVSLRDSVNFELSKAIRLERVYSDDRCCDHLKINTFENEYFMHSLKIQRPKSVKLDTLFEMLIRQF